MNGAMVRRKMSMMAVIGHTRNLLMILSAITIISGCTATHTMINKRKLDVQTQMSSTVFLDPITPDQKTILVQIRNTSDKQQLDLEQCIIAELQAKGYTIVQNPEHAHYLLQANVLQVGETDLRAAQRALSGGFGAALEGAVIGAAAGSFVAQDHKPVVAGGLLGSAVATVTDAVVQDVVYSVITDVQISERVANSVTVREKTKSKLKQGESGHKEVVSTQKINMNRYQTRIVSTANKVNLKFEKASPLLIEGLTHSIAGIF